MNQFSQPQARSTVALEVSRFMSRVYGWMMFGLLITSITGYVVGTRPELRSLFFPSVIAQLALFFAINFGLKRMSVGALTGCFLAYSFVSGVTFSSVFLLYNLNVIGQVFAITAGMFGMMAVYGFVTKRDLNPVGTFLGMAVWGLIIAMLVNFFLHSAAMDFGISIIGVIAFAGLTAFDVQKLKELGASGSIDSDMGHKTAVYGALILYLDFINLFLFLLRLFGGGGRSRD